MSYLDIADETLNRLRADWPTGAADEHDTAERVAAMKLSDFARAGLIVEVWSEVVGADILFVSDNVHRSKLKGRSEVVYRARELKKLARLPPDPPHLRTVHMVKEIFGGTIQSVEGRPQSSAIDASATEEVS